VMTLHETAINNVRQKTSLAPARIALLFDWPTIAVILRSKRRTGAGEPQCFAAFCNTQKENCPSPLDCAMPLGLLESDRCFPPNCLPGLAATNSAARRQRGLRKKSRDLTFHQLAFQSTEGLTLRFSLRQR
jgi:hypothetical protein